MPTALPPAARDALLAWYDANGRTIAFRASRDPFAILVSEVMAQQTQIARVVPAWEAFLARFPTVEALAAASPAAVLRQWQGMGYDRRALNLGRAAIAIRDEHGGRVPDDFDALRSLPGIGPYTARAVLAIAFGRPVSAVDTNVRRVIGRCLAIDGDSAALQSAADASVPRRRPADWTHALMDLGATVCKPRRPVCDGCPLRRWCAFAAGDAQPGPTRAPRSRPPAPFPSTTRWLRGRILNRLRSAEGATWTMIDEPIGDHDHRAVLAALEALAHDGLVELDSTDARRARLTTA